MEHDEVGTLRTLTNHREIMDRLIVEHGGRIANTAGDSVLVEFPSAVEAVQCAVDIQHALAAANQDTSGERRLQFRIGVHVGDVMVRGSDLLGDGVNIAARLESLADPGGICLSEAAYGYVRKVIPLAFTDLGPQKIKNIGEPVRAYALKATSTAQSRTETVKSPPLPDKPSIAVLPFTNMSGDPEQDYFADGIVEEIIAALSRFRSLFVIARNSTFTYKGKAVDVRQVSRELGVRYVLEGSVRKAGNRLRIIAQLIDATVGNHIWSERYDGELADIFDLQDRVTEAIVGAIEPTITLSEIERAKRKRPDSLDAYDCVMRALPAIWSQDAETTAEGLRLAEQAIALDSTYALPKALAAWCYAQRLSYLRTKNPAEDRSRATTLAQDAVRLDDNDPLVLTCAGSAHSILREHALAQSLIEKAMKLDPNSAWTCQRSGWINVYVRQSDKALEHFNRAMRLSPVDPLIFNIFIGIGCAYFAKTEYDEAARWIEKGLREKPDAVWANRALTASLYHAGRIDEAKITYATLLKNFPDLTISGLLERTPGSDFSRGKFVEAFRALGLPE
ncbi:adenylate/guanylate cyclase domain-containing protein [Microvirga sp. VF16]|uniref:adenylate/guanylate cyclase domain-containing protein n=1 Tax=Microvirga sp. VF16 TaxID=2807101 RepID=UPI00352FF14D